MKFSDIIIAVASFAVILLFLEVIVGLVLVPAIGWDWGPTVVGIICYLLSGLVVGVIFSRKIWEEAGIKTMAKIIVLGAVLFMLFLAVEIPTPGDWTPLVKQNYQTANPGKTLTTSQWWSVEQAALGEVIALNLSLGIVLSFIGLYIGSMLRKSRKS
ncbi:MAG TPA: hypothetical protein VMT42_01060 [candidate division Zixibacteria bacterium]|nr:hypothetical protein [candidate division Zixibacteria bacterium]